MVELLDTEEGWSPYLPLDDARLDDARAALRESDTATAAKYGRVYRLTPVRLRSIDSGFLSRGSAVRVCQGVDGIRSHNESYRIVQACRTNRGHLAADL